MDFLPEEPFRVEHLGGGRAIVHFNSRCDQARTLEHEKKLADLVATENAIVCDLSRTAVMASDWLRWLARLTSEARHAGKILAIVGLGGVVRKSTDVLGLGSALVLVDSIEEAWSR